MLTEDLIAVMISTVHGDVVEATAVTGVAEVVDLVSVAAVHSITPGLDSRSTTQVVIVATLHHYLSDEVVTEVEGMAECLPIVTQGLAVDVNLAITQSHAMLGTVL